MAVTAIDGGKQIRNASVSDGKLVESYIKANGTRAFTADQPLGGFKLTGLGDPSSAQDAATKAYVDSAAVGIDWKASVRAASTANVASLSGTTTIDGVSLSANDRVLLKDQSTASQNGIWVVAAGAWARGADADTAAEVTAGMAVFVEEGTVNADTGWVLTTNGAITVGTTSLAFTQFTGIGSLTAGNGLVKTGNTVDIVLGTNSGLVLGADTLSIQLNGSTLALAAGGISVAAGGITGTELNASVAGSGLSGGGGSALAVNVAASGAGTGGLQITSDNLEIKVDPAGGLALVTAGLKVTGGRPITREVPTGSINGSNTSYALANTPIAGSEEVFLNGILQNSGAGNDYTISGGTITYLTAPATGDVLLVSYRY